MQDRRDGQIHRISRDINRVIAGQVGGMRSLESGKCPIKNDKRDRGKRREDPPLEAEDLPEDVPVAERSEPEQVNPVRQRSPASEEDYGSDSENDKESAAVRPRRL